MLGTRGMAPHSGRLTHKISQVYRYECGKPKAILTISGESLGILLCFFLPQLLISSMFITIKPS